MFPASDFSVVKAVETTTDPAAFATVRFIVSAVPFLPFVVRSRGDIRTRNAGLELGLWASLGYLIEAVSLLTADAGRASFISLFTVIVVPLLDGMLGATVPARTWFGVLMSVLGVAMLESSGSPPNHFAGWRSFELSECYLFRNPYAADRAFLEEDRERGLSDTSWVRGMCCGSVILNLGCGWRIARWKPRA
ncbi:hypothetical protein LINPERPRIM_LOCUS34500 [Linum perenne]